MCLLKNVKKYQLSKQLLAFLVSILIVGTHGSNLGRSNQIEQNDYPCILTCETKTYNYSSSSSYDKEECQQKEGKSWKSNKDFNCEQSFVLLLISLTFPKSRADHQGCQFGLVYPVRVVSRQGYSTKWLNPNPTYLIIVL